MIAKKFIVLGAACAALVPVFLTACKEGPVSGNGGADAKPVAASGENAVPESAQSAHFAAVNGHLDLGGTLYAYMDVDGDVEKIAGMAQGFLDIAKQEAGADMPPHLKNLNVTDVLDELGLSGIEAMGASSVKDGAIYHNKAYVHIPGGRKGLLKILGGGAAPFASKVLAPADSDLAWEMTLDVQAGYEVVSTMVRRIGGPEADGEFQRAVGEMIPQLGLSMNDVLTKLKTRVTVIGRIHPDKPLEVPDAPVSIPSFDLLIALDDTGWLFDKIVGSIKKEVPEDQQAQMFASGDGFEKVMGPPMPSPDMVIAQPVIYHDIASQRVLIGSSQSFIDECLAVTSGLLDSDAYKKAAEGLPAEGNGLSYMSARLMKEYRRLIGEIMKSVPSGGGGANMSTMMVALMPMFDTLMPDIDQGQVAVTVNLPDGILRVSNATTSFKEAMVLGGVAMAASLGTATYRSSSMEYPMVPPAFDESDEAHQSIPLDAPTEALPEATTGDEVSPEPDAPEEPQASAVQPGSAEVETVKKAILDELDETKAMEAQKAKAASAIFGGGSFSPQ
jgi:hypothetical protein